MEFGNSKLDVELKSVKSGRLTGYFAHRFAGSVCNLAAEMFWTYNPSVGETMPDHLI